MEKQSEQEHVIDIKEKIIKNFGAHAPKWAVILGSGLGSAFDNYITATSSANFTDLGMPGSTVPGHNGKMIVGNINNNTKAVIMAGRVHLYEGYSVQEVVRGVRALALWGVKNFIITNAAGAIHHPEVIPRLMLIEDHINLTGNNPLIGKNEESFGPRFPDMSEVYSPNLIEHAIKSMYKATKKQIRTGVYASLSGPSYETPAEIRMLRKLGADAVGMSTVNEAIALCHMGIKNILGVSILCNAAAGLGRNTLSHKEVVKAADEKKDDLAKMIVATITTPMK